MSQGFSKPLLQQYLRCFIYNEMLIFDGAGLLALQIIISMHEEIFFLNSLLKKTLLKILVLVNVTLSVADETTIKSFDISN